MGLFGKPIAEVPANRVASGVVSRIALTDYVRSQTSSQYRCHILFEGQPGAASFGIHDADAAIALTRAGDEIRVEVDGEGDLTAFQNLTTGLSMSADGDE